eukprot:scaffold55604_cov78-Cyclotella_meneghiniana.AAC.1
MDGWILLVLEAGPTVIELWFRVSCTPLLMPGEAYCITRAADPTYRPYYSEIDALSFSSTVYPNREYRDKI